MYPCLALQAAEESSAPGVSGPQLGRPRPQDPQALPLSWGREGWHTSCRSYPKPPRTMQSPGHFSGQRLDHCSHCLKNLFTTM